MLAQMQILSCGTMKRYLKAQFQWGVPPVPGTDNLTRRAISFLHSLQKFPAKLRALFQVPSVPVPYAAV